MEYLATSGLNLKTPPPTPGYESLILYVLIIRIGILYPTWKVLSIHSRQKLTKIQKTYSQADCMIKATECQVYCGIGYS